MSAKQINYLKQIKRNKIIIIIIQLCLTLVFILTWELLSWFNIINSFIFSSPSKIIKTIINLSINNNLFYHIWITVKEILLSFSIGSILGFTLAIIFYLVPIIKKIFDPFITLFNSLPKVSLGPLLIIWLGANNKSIIVMSLLINTIVTLIGIYNGLINTDPYKIKLFNSLKASKKDLLLYLVIPHNKETIISSLKLNISMSLIGVIMGKFLVSKAGIGYLILYGTQVFNLNLVMSGIVLILIISFIIYEIINLLEKKNN
jgi:NitT/TauT family transport system permease protein